jgi:hypothetical protein
MPIRRDLPFLLKLLDDEAPEVRTQVSEALRSFGPTLTSWVAAYLPELNEAQRQSLSQLLQEMQTERVSTSWLYWLDYEDGLQSLERGLLSLSEMQYGAKAHSIPVQLDQLAQRFRDRYTSGGSADLMHFLFREEQYEAIDDAELHFEHHHLAYALTHRCGSSLALSCLAMLIGQRVGVSLYGIRIRGHFMAMALNEVTVEMYNPQERGKPLSRSSAIFMEEAMRRNLTWPREMQVHAFEVAITVLQSCISDLYQQKQRGQARRYRHRYQELVQELDRRGWLRE